MAIHAKYTLGCSRITKILDLLLAVPAFEAVCAECLIAGQNSEIFDLVPTIAAAVGAIVADERAIAEEEQIRV
jgi:hypothetical protein